MPAARSAVLGDGVAIGLSGLCLAHCLALPLAASLLPIAGAWAEAEWVHGLFVAVAAPVSLWTLGRSRSRNLAVVALAVGGLALMVAGAAGFPSHEAETPLTVAGGLLLALAHGLNWRRRQVACRHDRA
ncbi:MAG TPA: MerC domain-containing protein [Brevundimonas sp.]|uniref:MerC domain-containing protein n=1 Tax=Brevundimonas sp. TaxID=1871086 RepID=UPI00261662CD|nr:MerC domain-containing protein [Brevundimonas sp.]HRO31802.1 MerC domain-containing protein [Brevundimonas sp.]